MVGFLNSQQLDTESLRLFVVDMIKEDNVLFFDLRGVVPPLEFGKKAALDVRMMQKRRAFFLRGEETNN